METIITFIALPASFAGFDVENISLFIAYLFFTHILIRTPSSEGWFKAIGKISELISE
jgi:hypothetical protein